MSNSRINVITMSHTKNGFIRDFNRVNSKIISLKLGNYRQSRSNHELPDPLPLNILNNGATSHCF